MRVAEIVIITSRERQRRTHILFNFRFVLFPIYSLSSSYKRIHLINVKHKLHTAAKANEDDKPPRYIMRKCAPFISWLSFFGSALLSQQILHWTILYCVIFFAYLLCLSCDVSYIPERKYHLFTISMSMTNLYSIRIIFLTQYGLKNFEEDEIESRQ